LTIVAVVVVVVISEHSVRESIDIAGTLLNLSEHALCCIQTLDHVAMKQSIAFDVTVAASDVDSFTLNTSALQQTFCTSATIFRLAMRYYDNTHYTWPASLLR